MSPLPEQLRLDSFRFALEEALSEGGSDIDVARMAHDRADRAVGASAGRETWACVKGCAACCHLKVHVTPAEATRVAARLRGILSPFELDQLLPILAERAARGRELDPGDWRRAEIPCALLTPERTCRVYAERPVPCRIHVSSDAEACADPAAVVPLDRWLVLIGQALQRGLGAEDPVELHAALLEALLSS